MPGSGNRRAFGSRVGTDELVANSYQSLTQHPSPPITDPVLAIQGLDKLAMLSNVPSDQRILFAAQAAAQVANIRGFAGTQQ